MIFWDTWYFWRKDCVTHVSNIEADVSTTKKTCAFCICVCMKKMVLYIFSKTWMNNVFHDTCKDTIHIISAVLLYYFLKSVNAKKTFLVCQGIFLKYLNRGKHFLKLLTSLNTNFLTIFYWCNRVTWSKGI